MEVFRGGWSQRGGRRAVYSARLHLLFLIVRNSRLFLIQIILKLLKNFNTIECQYVATQLFAYIFVKFSTSLRLQLIQGFDWDLVDAELNPVKKMCFSMSKILIFNTL